MSTRKPISGLRPYMMAYNAFQVVFSAYMFIEVGHVLDLIVEMHYTMFLALHEAPLLGVCFCLCILRKTFFIVINLKTCLKTPEYSVIARQVISQY